MKTFLMATATLLALCVHAQTKDPQYPVKDGKACYEEVVQADSVTQDQLYLRCKAWFARTFNSANAVVQMDTKEEMIGKGIMVFTVFNVMATANVDIEFTISVKLKDGKYKYELTNFKGALYQWPLEDFIADEKTFKGNGKEKRLNMDYRKEMIKHSAALIASLKTAMNPPKDDGW